jgi:hypothetical protein
LIFIDICESKTSKSIHRLLFPQLWIFMLQYVTKSKYWLGVSICARVLSKSSQIEVLWSLKVEGKVAIEYREC